MLASDTLEQCLLILQFWFGEGELIDQVFGGVMSLLRIMLDVVEHLDLEIKVGFVSGKQRIQLPAQQVEQMGKIDMVSMQLLQELAHGAPLFLNRRQIQPSGLASPVSI